MSHVPPEEKTGLEPVLIAFAATSALAVVFVHPAALLARHILGEAGPAPAAAATWTVTAVTAMFAAAHLVIRRRAILPWISAALWMGGASLFAVSHPSVRAVALALLVVGVTQTQAEIRMARRLPSSLSGASRRRPVLSVLWGILAVLMLIQNARLSTYMADPSADWWLTTRNEFWSRHMCMPAYVEAADLHRQGVANVYSAEYYSALTRAAKPVLTVNNLNAFAGDPYQYPPQFLLLPHLALKLTNDFLTLRTFWYALQVAGFIAVALTLCAWIGGAQGVAAALLIPAVWISVPAMQCLQYGQFHLAAIVLAVGGMLAIEKRAHAVGGAMLALATLAKIFPGLLIVYLLVQRRWKAVAWTAGFAAGLSLLALLILGPRPFRAFVSYQLPRMQSGEAFDFAKEYPEYREWLIADNFSPAGVVAKLGELGLPFATPRAGRQALTAYSVLLLLVTFVAAHKGGSRRGRACIWLAILNLAALQSPGAFADYVTAGSVWALSLCPILFSGRFRVAVFAAICWFFFALIPGVPPVPPSLSASAMMALTIAGAALLVGFNVWVILRAQSDAGIQTEA